MEFRLKHSTEFVPTHCGFFVENSSMIEWISVASQLMNEKVQIFPIPGNEANTVCGALLIVDELKGAEIQQFPKVYRLGTAFYLLSGSEVSPKLNDTAINERFGTKPHFFHPVYGMCELQKLENWSSYLRLKPMEVKLTKPSVGPQFPQSLRDYFIREVPPEKVLQNLIENSVPNRKSLDSKPLSSFEKVKLRMYRSLLGKKSKDASGSAAKSDDAEASSSTIIDSTKKQSWWKRRKQKMQHQLEDLEDRNKKELDKLMDLLKNDPDEALKYALPIDRSGHSRGPEVGFTFQRRWGRGISNSSASGGSVNIGQDKAAILRAKYNEMASNYAANEQWEKASFVYLELLSDPHSAGNVLEKGKKYEAAGAIFLSKCKNKVRAAECYENGKFYGTAIDLYEELNYQIKAGDLYTKMGNEPKAKIAYTKEVTKMVESTRYFDAGGIAKTKLKDEQLARTHFWSGWKNGTRPNDCLNEFLDTFETEEKRKNIKTLHEEQLEGMQAHRFLEVLKDQTDKEIALKEDVELIVYETVARNSRKDKRIVNLLGKFNNSSLVSKDVMRFKKRL